MKWIETKVIFESEDKDLAFDLISNVFYDLGLRGLVVEDPKIEPAAGWGGGTCRKPEQTAVIGYLPKNEKFGEMRRSLEEQLKRIEKENGVLHRVVYVEIDETDWEESWKAYFWPEKITEKIVAKPTWRDYVSGPDEIILEIDPGMAFGTGTHPSTALSIQLIEKLIQPGDYFFDVGTGSGILMIAAAKLGAKTVWGIDNDPVAVDIAGKNLLLNRIAPEKFKVFHGHLVDGIKQRFDLVAANILTDVIVILLDDVRRVLTADGVFICSGITEENRAVVLKKMIETGFEILEICLKEKWVGIAGKIK